MTEGGRRALRIGWRVVLGIACVISVLCLGLIAAAYRNDGSIDAHLGLANAEVVSVSFDRTIIRYETPDGLVHTPPNGVLYPQGLAAGQLVRIEYNAADTDLARVAGRSAYLALLPLGSMTLFTWLIAGPLLWLLRRRLRQAETART